MRARPLSPPPAERALALGLFGLALVLVIYFFEQLPIEGTSLGLDWRKHFWPALAGGRLHYSDAVTTVRNPPWSLLLLVPLGLLSLRASWGVLTLVTLVILIVSVPRVEPRWRQWLGVLLLTASYPSLRHIADGNLEWMIIAGTLLILHGLPRRHLWITALGILLVTAKPQVVWMLLLALSWSLARTWPRADWLKLGGLLAVVVVPTLLWKGAEWWGAMVGIPEAGSILDVSLPAAANRLGLPPWVTWLSAALLFAVTFGLVLITRPELTREKATVLICASMLLSLYTAGNSFLTVLAVGIVPFFVAGHWLGLALIVLADLPILASPAMLFNYSAYYTTALLLLTWAIFVWRVWQAAPRQEPMRDRTAASA